MSLLQGAVRAGGSLGTEQVVVVRRSRGIEKRWCGKKGERILKKLFSGTVRNRNAGGRWSGWGQRQRQRETERGSRGGRVAVVLVVQGKGRGKDERRKRDWVVVVGVPSTLYSSEREHAELLFDEYDWERERLGAGVRGP